MTNWDKEVESSAGGFYGWGEKVGQKITGSILDYNPTGGSDFDGNTCPLLILELTEKSYSHSGQTGWSTLDNGTVAKLTCGLPSLNECVRLIQPGPGDLVQIELSDLIPTNKGNPAKIFKGRIARGQGQPQKQSAPAAAQSGSAPSFGDDGPPPPPPPDDSEPPF
jgi:hypothetical protein